MRAIHGTRRRAFEVDSFAVVTAAVTRTFELILACLPVWGATQMSAASVDDEHAIGCAVDPDAVFLLPLGVNTESVVRSVADLENCWRFEKRAGKKKTKERNEPSTEKSGDGNPNQAPPLSVDFTALGTDSGQTASGRCFGSTDGRRTYVSRCYSRGSGFLC